MKSELIIGDGGTPLVCPLSTDKSRYFQLGITSWGIGCNTKDLPGMKQLKFSFPLKNTSRFSIFSGVYVDVSKFTSWIQQKMSLVGSFIDEK